MKRVVGLVLVAALLSFGCGDDGDNTGNPDATTTPDATTSPDTTTPPDTTVSGTSEFNLTIEEVAWEADTLTFTGSTETPSDTFGASIENGRLRLAIQDADVTCRAYVDTSATNTVPGTFQTDSGFTDSAWVELNVENVFYDMQGSGEMTIDRCPALGDLVTATLSSVRLASSIDSSVKLVSGTITVEVTADDGSLSCQ